MKIEFLQLLFILCSGICSYGVTKTSISCSCEPGFTGEFCETNILSYSGSGEGSASFSDLQYALLEYTKKKNVERCIHGSPIYMNSCVCDFGYTGVSCDTLIEMPFSGSGFGNGIKKRDGNEIVWSRTSMDLLSWKPMWNIPIPSKEMIDDDHIMEDQFVAVESGISGTKTALHIASDKSKSESNIYRFTFIPNPIGGKSRLELTTCFTHYEDIIEKYNKIPKEVEWMMKTSCRVSRLPLQLFHKYKYEIYIPREDFDLEGQYILTQWHGTADPTLLKDENGCVAQIKLSDLHRICSKGKCEQGQIFNSVGHYIGLRYQQGGYPPLTMSLKDGHFVIMARSDEKVFIDKGGCSAKGLKPAMCMHHPRQHYNLIWKLPAKDFKFDQFVKFQWEVKWSEYSKRPGEYQNGGIRTSESWIRVWMDDVMIVDWRGPCGRNDGSTPYFKAGIYNPSGSTVPVRFFFRRYSHTYTPVDDHKDEKVRQTLKNLTICEHEAHDINQNAITDLKNYRFMVVSSASENKCILHSKVHHIEYLKSIRYSRMLVDSLTKDVIKHLVYALDDQNIKMQQLEERIKKYESSPETTEENNLEELEEEDLYD